MTLVADPGWDALTSSSTRPIRCLRLVVSGAACRVLLGVRQARRSAQPERARRGRHSQPVTRSARRRWTVRAVRYGLPLAALLVESLLWNPVATGPVAVDAVQINRPVTADIEFCVQQVTELVRRDLDQMAHGAGPDLADQPASAGEPVVGLAIRRHLTLAHERVMQTAGADFFAMFNRDADRELKAYAPRVHGACATP